MLPAAPLATSRLMLQPLVHSHTRDLFQVYSDSQAMRWWHHLPHQTLDETLQMIANWNQSEPAWAVMLKGNERVIGMVQYLDAAVPGLGYIFGSEYWRQGYGSEAVAAAVAFGFTSMNLNRIELWIHNENIGSQKLANKIGFRQRGQFYQHYGHFAMPHETLVFGLRADEWMNSALNVPREAAIYGVAPTVEVADVAMTLAFYHNMLGFQIDFQEGYPPNFAIVSRGEWTTERAYIHIAQSDTPVVGSLYFRMGAAVAELFEEFRQRGVVIEVSPQQTWYGTREFTVLDPNGWKLRFSGSA